MDQLNPDVPYLLDLNQICLPIEYPYRILSIFPTDSRRNQAGTSIVSTFDTAYEDMTPR